MTDKTSRAGFQPRDWLEDKASAGLIALMRALPYRYRVPLMGALWARLIAPLTGQRRRIRSNLALAMPELPEDEVARLCRAVPDNLGRSVIEMFSPEDLMQRAAQTPIGGPGLAVMDRLHGEGRPAVLVTGHLGNYDVARAVLHARGYKLGALYRPMSNRFFNRRYERMLTRIDTPMFPRSRAGMAQMVKFLRAGGMLTIVADQRIGSGAPLRFFGREARTALSAAELALRFDAPLIPGYAIRRPDGLSFDIIVEDPVPRGSAEEMMQALNDSLEAQIRTHPEQWLWTHRRWKQQSGQGSSATASTGP